MKPISEGTKEVESARDKKLMFEVLALESARDKKLMFEVLALEAQNGLTVGGTLNCLLLRLCKAVEHHNVLYENAIAIEIRNKLNG